MPFSSEEALFDPVAEAGAMSDLVAGALAVEAGVRSRQKARSASAPWARVWTKVRETARPSMRQAYLETSSAH